MTSDGSSAKLKDGFFHLDMVGWLANLLLKSQLDSVVVLAMVRR